MAEKLQKVVIEQIASGMELYRPGHKSAVVSAVVGYLTGKRCNHKSIRARKSTLKPHSRLDV